jgi:NTE family protein
MRALVLSGGGSKGQYHVGAVAALVGELGRTYRLYAGVSVGALVAAFLAQYPSSKEQLASADLSHLFTPIKNRDIYKRWFPFGKLHTPWKPAMYSASPLRRLVEENLNLKALVASGKLLRIGTTSLTSGSYTAFTEADKPLKDIVYASAAFPGAFPPGRFADQWWTDGGVRTVTPIHAAIQAGATEVDVVMCHPPKSARKKFDGKPRTFEVLFRMAELMNDQIVEDDLKKAQLYNRVVRLGGDDEKKDVKFNVVRPTHFLNSDSLEFDPDEAVGIQDTGFDDVLKAFRAV